MRPSLTARWSWTAILRRELIICLAVGAPALLYVLAINRTASLAVILVHALLLAAFVPLAISALEVAIPPATRVVGWRSVVRAIAVRQIGLVVATFATVLVIAASTPLSLAVLVGGPLVVSLAPVLLAYAMVAVALQWSELRQHALRAEANEARARQAALAARIRPHFLFNALNCIEELADTDPPAARVAVGRLARLLRAVLQASSNPKGRLEDELRLVDDYLGLEQIRFGDRLRYDLEVALEAKARTIPTTVLLTLAENAVKHGVESTRTPSPVVLRAHLSEQGGLQISLDAPAADAADAEARAPARARYGMGYGLADVRERLALAYGDRASVTLSAQGGRSHVELVIPE